VALTWTRTHDWDAERWRTKSLCRDSNIEVFFPVGTTGPAVELIAMAKEICRACPVNAQCLEFALETGQEAGVWGGFTEDERRAMRKSRNAGERTGAAAG
jgi:WhiB family redox-sensing transcriptional regulator